MARDAGGDVVAGKAVGMQINITESQISDLDHFTTTYETDPIFGTSIASGILLK